MSNLSPMKILLIYPYFLETRVLTAEDVSAVPLGVYYVAAVLKENNSLSGFVDAVDLIDKEDLYPLHSKFFSRLAMTFDYGD
ncbi:MAG: hypothetical protein JRC59_06990, partial [Deltaproteobacteria bacterium]|nr:hypothetical protein [Deltaproteobacteria bacterium]